MPFTIEGNTLRSYIEELGVTEVTVPAHITEIGEKAFQKCRILTRIILPEGLRTIGDNAFQKCYVLRELDIPDSVETLGRGICHSCTRLERVRLPKGLSEIPQDAFNACRHLQSVILPERLETVGYRAFEKCSKLETLALPETVKHIRERAFYESPSLRTLHLPETLDELGDFSLECTRFLEEQPAGLLIFGKGLLYRYTEQDADSVTVPEGVRRICRGAFQGHEELREVTLPSTLREIGNWAFKKCTHLRAVHIPDGVTTIGEEAFSMCEALEAVYLPPTVTHVGRDAFFMTGWRMGHNEDFLIVGDSVLCGTRRGMSTATVPEGVRHIGEAAFRNAPKLIEVTLPVGVEDIGHDAFAYDTGLERVSLPEGLRCIGQAAFLGCHRLKRLHIPESVEEIGDAAFLACRELHELHFRGRLKKLGTQAFPENTTVRFTLPEGELTLYLKDAWGTGGNEERMTEFLMTDDTARREVLWNALTNKEYKTGAGLFLLIHHPETERVSAWAKRTVKRLGLYCTEHGDAEALSALLERGFVTARQIDALLESAISTGSLEIQAMLLDYKNARLGYEAGEKRFKL